MFRPEELTSQDLGEASSHLTNGMQEPNDSRNKTSGTFVLLLCLVTINVATAILIILLVFQAVSGDGGTSSRCWTPAVRSNLISPVTVVTICVSVYTVVGHDFIMFLVPAWMLV